MEDRKWNGLLVHGSELRGLRPSRGSKRRRVLVVGRRVAVNKSANGEDSDFRLQGNNCVRVKGKERAKKRRVKMRSSKALGSLAAAVN